MIAALIHSSHCSSLQVPPSPLNIYHFPNQELCFIMVVLTSSDTQVFPSHTSPTGNPFQHPHVPHVSQTSLSPTRLQTPAEGPPFAKYHNQLIQLPFPVTHPSAPCKPQLVKLQAPRPCGARTTRETPLTSAPQAVSPLIQCPRAARTYVVLGRSTPLLPHLHSTALLSFAPNTQHISLSWKMI